MTRAGVSRHKRSATATNPTPNATGTILHDSGFMTFTLACGLWFLSDGRVLIGVALLPRGCRVSTKMSKRLGEFDLGHDPIAGVLGDVLRNDSGLGQFP